MGNFYDRGGEEEGFGSSKLFVGSGVRKNFLKNKFIYKDACRFNKLFYSFEVPSRRWSKKTFGSEQVLASGCAETDGAYPLQESKGEGQFGDMVRMCPRAALSGAFESEGAARSWSGRAAASCGAFESEGAAKTCPGEAAALGGAFESVDGRRGELCGYWDCCHCHGGQWQCV